MFGQLWRRARSAPRTGTKRPCRPLAAAHEAADGSHELVGLVRLVLRAHDAVPGVLVEEAEGHLVERRLDRGDLRDHIDAVAVVVDHALHSTDLAFHAPQALLEL